MSNKKTQKDTEFDNLFRPPYNLKLTYEDIFGMLVFLEKNDFQLLYCVCEAEHQVELTQKIHDCMPTIINNDDDFLRWIKNIECIKDVGSLSSISFEDYYAETLIKIKKSIIDARKNKNSMDYQRSEDVQIRTTDKITEFLFETYKDENFSCLKKEQIGIALEKRDKALSLLLDIGDMFGELRVGLMVLDEETGLLRPPKNNSNEIAP